MATDIAFALGVLALLGSRIPSGLKVFLAALAIADDIGAILVIAIFYTATVHGWWLAAAALLLVILFTLNRMGVDSPWPYAVFGTMLWFAVLMSGIHATIAGVLVAFTIPATAKIDPLHFVRHTRERLKHIETAHVPGAHVLDDTEQQQVAFAIRREATHTAAPLQRLETGLHPWTTFLVLPLFALGNAGVRIVGAPVAEIVREPIVMGVFLGLVVGKPLGITLMSWMAVKLRLADLPEGVSWGQMIGVGILAGIGFTMSIFVANLAFNDAAHVDMAKAAVLVASLVAGVVGYFVIAAFSKRD
jgi:Na+:H+ antiporter, NhaA family